MIMHVRAGNRFKPRQCFWIKRTFNLSHFKNRKTWTTFISFSLTHTYLSFFILICFKVSPALVALSHLLFHNDGDVLADTCWALSYLSVSQQFSLSIATKLILLNKRLENVTFQSNVIYRWNNIKIFFSIGTLELTKYVKGSSKK